MKACAYSRQANADLSSTHMYFGHLHIPPMIILLAILGFSLLIAALDFVKRRARLRAPATLSRSVDDMVGTREMGDTSDAGDIGNASPMAPTISPELNPTPEPRIIAPIGGLLGLPYSDRGAPSLPCAGFLPLPKPTPRMPRGLECLDTAFSWSQEA
jgi:hypothetical protein